MSGESELLERVERLAAAVEAANASGGWFDRKNLANAGIAAAVGVLVAIFGTGGWQERLRVVESSAAQNAGEIRRVEADSVKRDDKLEQKVDRAFSEHMQYQHSGKRTSLWEVLPTPPLLAAQARPLPALSPAPTPPLRDLSEPCCAGILVSEVR